MCPHAATVIRSIGDQRRFPEVLGVYGFEHAPHVAICHLADAVVAYQTAAQLLGCAKIATCVTNKILVEGVQSRSGFRIALVQVFGSHQRIVVIPQFLRRIPSGMGLFDIHDQDPGAILWAFIHQPLYRFFCDLRVVLVFPAPTCRTRFPQPMQVMVSGLHTALFEQRVYVQTLPCLGQATVFHASITARFVIELANGRKQDAIFRKVMPPASGHS